MKEHPERSEIEITIHMDVEESTLSNKGLSSFDCKIIAEGLL